MADDELADLRAAKAGDWDATARLLVRASGQLARRVAHRIELNPFLPFSTDDVLQEVFIDVFRGMNGCLADDERSLFAWLHQICDRRLSQMLREQGAVKRGGETKTLRGGDEGLRSSVAMLVARLADYRFDMPSEALARDEAVQAVVEGLRQLPKTSKPPFVYTISMGEVWILLRRNFSEPTERSVDCCTAQKLPCAVRSATHRVGSVAADSPAE